MDGEYLSTPALNKTTVFSTTVIDIRKTGYK